MTYDKASYNREYKRTHKEILSPKNREYRKKWRQKLSPDKIEKRRADARLYYKQNQEKIREYQNKYKTAHRKEISEQIRLRRAGDINVRLAHCLRSRLRNALKNNIKTGSFVSDLGCPVSYLRLYLESKFIEGMYWDNHGKWHIDHIIPLASFDLTNREELLKACHYTNLQPLWAVDNIRKGSNM